MTTTIKITNKTKERYKKEWKKYMKEREKWDKLMLWAKSKGFKE